MKNILSICLLFFALEAFAQSEEVMNSTVVKAADLMANGMCDCFNKHLLNKLSPVTRKGLDKLIVKGVKTQQEAQRVLSIHEMSSMNTEMQTLIPNEDDDENEFNECKEDVSMSMFQFQGEMTEIKAKGIITDEEFERQMQVQMPISMKKNENCKTFYYIYLISQSDDTKR